MQGPTLVHYLPVLTTLLSAAFLGVLLRRASKRQWAAHLCWWAIGVFFYGLGTALESSITLSGNTALLNRLWYWAGAILGGYPLATGSLYLLARRGWAHALTSVSLVFVVIASVAVMLSPIDASAIDNVRPSGRVLEWQWVRLMTPFINLYAVLFLVGGAIYSSVNFFIAGDQPRRAAGTALIALGGILPGIGGTLTKTHDLPEALYIGELFGLILIWIGFELCTRSPAPIPGESGCVSNDPGAPDELS